MAPTLLARPRPAGAPEGAQVRTFSENELTAWPARRLRLACQAQCEPLCAIHWLLDGKPLLAPFPVQPEAAGSPSPSSPLASSPSPSWPPASSPAANETARLARLQLQVAGRAHSALLLQRHALERANRSAGRPGLWLASSAYLLGGGASAELGELQEAPPATGGAPNVLSQLEITYNQLAQLLLAQGQPQGLSPPDELAIDCVVAPSLPAARSPLVAYTLVPPGRWFPPSEPANWPQLTGDSGPLGALWPREQLAGLPGGGATVAVQRTSVLLERPPRNLSVALWWPGGATQAAPVSSTGAPSSSSPEALPRRLRIHENQIGQIFDPQQASAPTLKCLASGATQYKWTFG